MKKATLILLILAAFSGLWGAAHTHKHLRAYRVRHQLLPAAPLENASPLLAFTTVALGGFRGLITDLLWLRIIRLQQEGRMFEIAQLADWITKLEPHFTTVWAFQAWNMAYNISVLFPDAPNRWRWVNNGIRLLRNQGIRYNPRNPNLYRELGWLYQHKIGYFMDSAHPFYKQQLAQSMHAVLHGPRLEDNHNDADLQVLREEMKLDPQLMQQLDAEYGPFDWRLPETHALYWAWLGRRMTPDIADQPRSQRRLGLQGCEQMMFRCLSAAFRQGRLEFDPVTELYVTTPNLDALPSAMRIYEDVVARYDPRFYREVYAAFLVEAVVILHCYGRDAQAREIFNRALGRYSDIDPSISYDDFVKDRLARMQAAVDDLPPADAAAVVEGLLFQAVLQKRNGDQARASELERHSQDFWGLYMRARGSEDHRLRTGLPAFELLRQQAERRAAEEDGRQLERRGKPQQQTND